MIIFAKLADIIIIVIMPLFVVCSDSYSETILKLRLKFLNIFIIFKFFHILFNSNDFNLLLMDNYSCKL